jgi:hypothetical protein
MNYIVEMVSEGMIQITGFTKTISGSQLILVLLPQQYERGNTALNCRCLHNSYIASYYFKQNVRVRTECIWVRTEGSGGRLVNMVGFSCPKRLKWQGYIYIYI